MERFIHEQSCGKLRSIDNGRKGLHNHHTSANETIYTTSVDFIAAAARFMVLLVAWIWCGLGPWEPLEKILAALPEWCRFKLSIDDLQDAYRQCPVWLPHLCVNVVGFWHVVLKQWRYLPLYGNVFGLLSAVLNFNRLPTLGVAVARRLLAILVTAFFDDNATLDLVLNAMQAQRGVHQLLEAVRAQVSPRECFPMADHRI